MILQDIYIRFFRSFNYDYLRRSHSNYRQYDWDSMGDGKAYPYVHLKIDPELTTIVGANESGKSQLLLAVRFATGAKSPTPSDFCRYSDYFTVTEEMKLPHFGLSFSGLTPEETDSLNGLTDGVVGTADSFSVFRSQPDSAIVYANGEDSEITDIEKLNAIMPDLLDIDPRRALPDSVPISYLADKGKVDGYMIDYPRNQRLGIAEIFSNQFPKLRNGQPDQIASFTNEISSHLSRLGGIDSKFSERNRNQLDLAYDLLVTVSGIHPTAFSSLQTALNQNDQGHANGIMHDMNEKIEEALLLSRRWSQDQKFRLAITARDTEIVFTIRDRTGSEYSFHERSSGLKYFLSYLVQFLVHNKRRERPAVLMMDEPDAYLSNQGQQDLVRLLHEFIQPAEETPTGQVLYVTHSPFMIDKNRADRIRVLDKGSDDEGVRVVHDIARNHFEPLRTAMGGFVGETVYIGNCNILVEGASDQIYLARMSELLAREGYGVTDRLDLNHVTLVPADSADNIPYMIFLACGRGEEKPAIVVLLDGDEKGNKTKGALKKIGPKGKQLIREQYILQINQESIAELSSERPDGAKEIEDLVPLEIGVEAAKEYLAEISATGLNIIPSVEEVRGFLEKSRNVLETIQAGLSQPGIETELSKIGFARHAVLAYKKAQNSDSESSEIMRKNFLALFSRLGKMQREAERELEIDSLTTRISQVKKIFFSGLTTTTTNGEVNEFLERIEALVGPYASWERPIA